MTAAPVEVEPRPEPLDEAPPQERMGLPLRASVYYWAVVAATLAATLPWIARLDTQTRGWTTFAILAGCAATAQLFVVLTTKDQSYHTAIIFLVAAVLLLPPELVALMGVVQHVPEWIKKRYAWYIQSFNICNYTLSALGALAASRLPGQIALLDRHVHWALAGILAAVVFVGLNHALLAAMLYLARGHHPRDTGLFSVEGLSTDLVLVSLGVAMATFWDSNPWVIPFTLAPIALIHRALHVPQLQEQARVDPKTGLFNARHFSSSFQEELARARRFNRPLSLIMADLDLLRDINNTYGHLAGDAVLAGIAAVFRDELRHYDVPARFGGEEFAILLPETPYDKALEIAERVRAAVAERRYEVDTSSEPIGATVSMGVASFPDDGGDPNELVHHADLAVYRAKMQGRNRVMGRESADLPVPAEAVKKRAPLAVVPSEERTYPIVSGESANRTYPVVAGGASAAAQPPAEPPVHALPVEDPPPSAERLELADAIAAADEAREPRHPAASEPRFLALSARLGTFVAAVAAAGLSAGAAGLLLGGSRDFLGLVALVALVAGGQALALEVDDGSISVSAVGALTAAALFGPRAALPVAAATALVEWAARRSPVHRVLFNVATLALASLAATAVFDLAQATGIGRGSTAIGGLVAGGAYYAVNMLLLSLALAFEGRESPLRVLSERFLWLLPHYLGYGLVGGVLAIAYGTAGLYAFAVAAVPLVLMRKTQAAYLAHTQRSAHKLRAAADTIQQQNISLERANRLLRDRSTAAMESLSATVDARDAYTAGHSRRVRRLALAIGRELGLSAPELEILGNAALFHDIGKIAIPDSVLLKPGKLNPDEWALMQSHAEEGARIIDRLGFLADAVPAIRHHHERFDGSGYPQRLKGEEIPVGARVIHVADALDSMLTMRVYRAGLPPAQAMAELRNGSGRQFCPRCVEALERIVPKDELDGHSRPELLIAS